MAKRKSTAKHKSKQQAHGKASRQRQRRQPDKPILGLALAGMAITAWLTWTASTSGPLPLCGEGSACDLIQSSRWSTLFGIPVALFGFLTYLLLAFVSFEMRPTLKRWRWQWTVALVGVSVSVYLTLTGLIALQSVCLWCLASLAIISAIFVRVMIVRPNSAPGMPWRDWTINTGAVAFVVLAVMQLHYSGLLGGMGPANPRLQALAEHLDESDAEFYGAFWCPACQQQKELFGAAADELPYIECYPEGRNGPIATQCVTTDIGQSFPTWIIDGERHTGIMAPEELARQAGFDWDGFEADDAEEQ